MYKFVFSAVVCAVMCIPAASFAQDCGCGCEPAPNPCCVKTRKKFKLVDVQKQVCRTKRVCTVDECGCPTKKRVRVQQCVTRKKLTRVEVPVDPCRKGLRGRLGGLMNRGGGCCEPDPCGCAAPAPCCGDAAPAMAPSVVEGVPMAAPAAPCCGG